MKAKVRYACFAVVTLALSVGWLNAANAAQDTDDAYVIQIGASQEVSAATDVDTENTGSENTSDDAVYVRAEDTEVLSIAEESRQDNSEPTKEAVDKAVKEPVIAEPIVKEPVVAEPIVKEPVVVEPIVKEPVVVEPVKIAEPSYTESEQEAFIQVVPQIQAASSIVSNIEIDNLTAGGLQSYIVDTLDVMPAYVKKLTIKNGTINENDLVFIRNNMHGIWLLDLGGVTAQLPDDKFGNGFAGNEILQVVVLPKGIIELGSYAFRYCPNLYDITIQEGLEKIGSYAFDMCENLYGVHLPDSVKEIGNVAFLGDRNLVDINIPANIETIGALAFMACSGITTLDLPNTLTNIMSGAFTGSGLTEIVIPNSITAISESAFYTCARLEKVTISENVTSIAYRAFANCIGLKKIIIYNETAPIDALHSEILLKAPLERIEVPGSILEDYKNDGFWGAYKDIIFPLPATYTVSAAASPVDGGSVSGVPAGKVLPGETVTLEAAANSGYAFVGWEVDGVTVGDLTANPLVFEMPSGNVSVTALFYVPVTGITPISQLSVITTALKTVALKAQVAPINATNQTILWSSSNPLIADVSADGTVRARKIGTAFVTATTADGGFQYKFTVIVR